MNATAEDTLYYLIVDVQNSQPILVFLGSDPAEGGGPQGEPVQLQLLSPFERFGRPGRPCLGRPVLGKSRNSKCYKEFCSAEDLWEAGFLPVSSYRVCDEWFDYHEPWSAPPETGYTTAASQDESI
jgi:hypothetical protein